MNSHFPFVASYKNRDFDIREIKNICKYRNDKENKENIIKIYKRLTGEKHIGDEDYKKICNTVDDYVKRYVKTITSANPEKTERKNIGKNIKNFLHAKSNKGDIRKDVKNLLKDAKPLVKGKKEEKEEEKQLLKDEEKLLEDVVLNTDKKLEKAENKFQNFVNNKKSDEFKQDFLELSSEVKNIKESKKKETTAQEKYKKIEKLAHKAGKTILTQLNIKTQEEKNDIIEAINGKTEKEIHKHSEKSINIVKEATEKKTLSWFALDTLSSIWSYIKKKLTEFTNWLLSTNIVKKLSLLVVSVGVIAGCAMNLKKGVNIIKDLNIWTIIPNAKFTLTNFISCFTSLKLIVNTWKSEEIEKNQDFRSWARQNKDLFSSAIDQIPNILLYVLCLYTTAGWGLTVCQMISPLVAQKLGLNQATEYVKKALFGEDREENLRELESENMQEESNENQEESNENQEEEE